MGFSLFNVDKNGFSDIVTAPIKQGILYKEFEAEKLTAVFNLRDYSNNPKELLPSDLIDFEVYRNAYNPISGYGRVNLWKKISPITFCGVAKEYEKLADHFFVILDKLLETYTVDIRINTYTEKTYCDHLNFSAQLISEDNQYYLGSSNGLSFYIPIWDMLEL